MNWQITKRWTDSTHKRKWDDWDNLSEKERRKLEKEQEWRDNQRVNRDIRLSQ